MKKRPTLVLALMLNAMMVIITPFMDSESFASTIHPAVPDSISGAVDSEFDLIIQVEGVSGLFGASFVLNFDKNYLNAVLESNESFLGGDVIFISQHDNTNGTAGIGVTKKAGQNASYGSGDLASIRFKLIKPVGQDTAFSFILSDVSANDSLGDSIPLTVNPDSAIVFYPYALFVSQSSWASPAEGGSDAGIVVSNSRSDAIIGYSISEASEWLTVSPSSGATPGGITITTDSNRGGSARTAVVTVTATSPAGVAGSLRRITVTQKTVPPTLSVSDTVWTAPAGGGDNPQVQITNSGSTVTIVYALSENSDWLSVSASGGSTPGAFQITAQANRSGNVREDTVIVTAVSPSGVSNFQRKVIITQQPLPPPAVLRPVCPDSIPGTADAEFDVSIEVVDATDLFGMDFILQFDQSFLAVVFARAGSFLGTNIQFIPLMDNSNGRVIVHISQNAGQEGADGSGIVALFRFKVIHDALQDTTLGFTFSSVAASDSATIPIDLLPGSGETRLKAVNDGIDNGRSSKPITFQLYQNTPNPFNPTTTIRYSIPKAGEVSLEVFDGLGRLIATLFKGHRETGEYDEVFDSRWLSSGVYYCRLEADGAVMTRKMMLVR